MKTTFFTAALALSVVSAKKGLLKQEQLDDFDFLNQMNYNMYNGFVRGLYREHTHKVVDEQCFGAWIKEDMSHLNDVMYRFFMFEFPISYEDSLKAATDVVNLFYMNQRYCSAYKIYDDLKSVCGEDLMECFDPETFMENGKNALIPLFTRGEQIVSLLFRDEFETDEEVLQAMDKFGENLGYITSYVLGFDKRFITDSKEGHRHALKSSKKHSAGLLKGLF